MCEICVEALDKNPFGLIGGKNKIVEVDKRFTLRKKTIVDEYFPINGDFWWHKPRGQKYFIVKVL